MKIQQVPKQLSLALREDGECSVTLETLLAKLASLIFNAVYRLLSAYLKTDAVNDSHSREMKP